ncbi:transposase-like protein [Arthrobacter sp. V4I6]|nr:transposase-like protein [Arthrobacter sp. V1I7]MDQ0854703.1 transposase-like protein [Arthrobacter sp. V4I6]
MLKPFPAEFRRDVVAVARRHEAPISQIAKDFGISEATLHNWLSRKPTSRTAGLKFKWCNAGELARGFHEGAAPRVCLSDERCF